MIGTVESPIFNEKYAIGDNTPTVNAYCPIDGTQLVTLGEYDFFNYSCFACGTTYRYGDMDAQSLRNQAALYASQINQRRMIKQNELAKLEKVVQAAHANGII